MIVVLEPSMFTSPDVEVSTLVAFRNLGTRHAIQTEPLFDLGGDDPVNRWLEDPERCSPLLRDEFVATLDDGMQQTTAGVAPCVTVRVSASAVGASWSSQDGSVTLPPEPALALLREPLVVLLENRRNDGDLLRKAAPGDWHVVLEEALESRHVRFDSGGGVGEMRKILERDWKHDDVARLRLWTMFDRDCDTVHLDYRGSDPSNELADACRDTLHMAPAVPDGKRARKRSGKGAFHQLKRRSMENYIPPTLLSLWCNWQENTSAERLRPVLRDYRRMPAEMRHHYHLRDGLQKDRKGTQGVSDRYAPYNIGGSLERGFGDKLGNIWSEQHEHPGRRGRREAKKPTSWSDGVSSLDLESWFLDDGSSDELHALVRSILAWM